MIELGYSLSSEEFGPHDLIDLAQRAEAVGFEFALISDHYHPWTDRQGQSPFVWSVIGGIAQVTRRLRVGTGVTCPTIRMHPAIVAQAAATAAVMMPNRFFLGVGSGENLNEHIFGQHWPPPDVRLEMLAEAIAVLRALWRGGEQSHRGVYYTVENARIYTRPDQPPPLLIAAAGARSAELAGRLGDGLISTQPDAKLVRTFARAGGADKPRYGHLTVCWAPTQAQARRTAYELWPNAAIPRALHTELALPKHFEEAAKTVNEEAIGEHVICGPDPEHYLSAIAEFQRADFTHVYLHQIGPDQEGFFRFWQAQILPRLAILERQAHDRKDAKMAKIEQSVTVNVPVSTAYNQWTQFEDFPKFMQGIREVKQLDDTHLYFRAQIGGKEKAWEARITEQLPDERIAWTTAGGAYNGGVVTFHRLNDHQTRIMLQIEYDPQGLVEQLGDAVGVVSARIHGDLQQFKKFIEGRGTETGAWRGEVHHQEL